MLNALSRVDHLIYATHDLRTGVATIESILGVRPSFGGRHPAWGTCNALVRVGSRAYIEVLAPDPEHAGQVPVRIFDTHELGEPRLVTWAAKAADLEHVVERASACGMDLGTVRSGSRRQPDGGLLTWRLTDPFMSRAAGIVPFFIDWRGSQHPSETLANACTLRELRAEHPDAEYVRAVLAGLGLDLRVDRGSRPRLIGRIDSPRGTVDLR